MISSDTNKKIGKLSRATYKQISKQHYLREIKMYSVVQTEERALDETLPFSISEKTNCYCKVIGCHISAIFLYLSNNIQSFELSCTKKLNIVIWVSMKSIFYTKNILIFKKIRMGRYNDSNENKLFPFE